MGKRIKEMDTYTIHDIDLSQFDDMQDDYSTEALDDTHPPSLNCDCNRCDTLTHKYWV